MDTVRWLFSRHPRLALLVHPLSLAWLLILVVGLSQPYLDPPAAAPDAPLGLPEALLLGAAFVTMLTSALLMVISTRVVLPACSRLEGWRTLLLVAWFVPFLGLPLYLSYRRLRDGVATNPQS
ncbi:hypothetical protein SAMN04488509_1049 [Aquimonas voraii]|uniref:Uncharacterized protein n=2 Tax=Aquimonas voraii TaxID=265719 RepID=A0A1G6VZN4_9GAMM|nr:hypothetical protein SAMN04488509_1049 [Aquimonas voraii]